MRSSVGLLTVPFVPSSVGTVLGWWDASRLALNDGDAVGSWADLSGNGRTLTNAVTASKPTFKTGIFGARPAVRGDGNDCLSVASFISAKANVTFAAVFRTAVSQSNKYWWSATAAGDGSNGFDVHFSSGTVIGSYLVTNLQVAAELTQAVTYSDGAARVLLCSFQQGDTAGEHALHVAKGYADESTRVTLNKTDGATVYAPGNFALFTLDPSFTSFGAQIDLGEVLVYGSALTLAQRTVLRAYLSTKWGAT